MTSVRTEIQEGLCIVHLDDGKANAINGPLLDGLSAALDEAEAKNLAMVINGRAGFFSGGLDLKTLPTLDGDALMKVLKQFGDVMLRMFSFPRPMVAACTGHAIAGGMVMLLACDDRIAAEGKFRLGLNETAIGMSLPLFVTEFVRCQIAPQHLKSVITNGELFQAPAAKDIGLVDSVVPADQVLQQAIQRAKTLCVLPGQAYADNKQSVRGPHAQLGQAAYGSELERFRGFFGA
jgi:enoyl-CoA hydratase